MTNRAENPKRPTQAEAARTLLATASRGILATIAANDGYPYASVVELLPTEEGDVVLLLSNLAEHTRNVAADDRVSIVLNEQDLHGEVLALGRATYKGRIAKVEARDEVRDAYLELHPAATLYVDFADFNFFRISVEAVRYIGGFGRMSWIDHDTWAQAEVDPLADAAAGVIAHMNEDHPHNLLDYAHAFTDANWAQRAVMVRLDKLGFDLRVEGDEQSGEVRVGFAEPKLSSEAIHEVMVRLAREAREVLGK